MADLSFNFNIYTSDQNVSLIKKILSDFKKRKKNTEMKKMQNLGELTIASRGGKGDEIKSTNSFENSREGLLGHAIPVFYFLLSEMERRVMELSIMHKQAYKCTSILFSFSAYCYLYI